MTMRTHNIGQLQAGWVGYGWTAPLWDMKYELGIAFIKTCLGRKKFSFSKSQVCASESAHSCFPLAKMV